MKFFTFISILLVTGCSNCEIILSMDYVKTCDEIYGVTIGELEVNQFDSQGVPVDYNIIQELAYSTHLPDGINRIDFFSKNEGGNWTYRMGEDLMKTVDTIPFDIREGYWYLFKRIPTSGFYSGQSTTVLAKGGKNREFEKMFMHFMSCNCYKQVRLQNTSPTNDAR